MFIDVNYHIKGTGSIKRIKNFYFFHIGLKHKAVRLYRQAITEVKDYVSRRFKKNIYI